jgi:soluble lytic murein transglycosylase-like protein
MKKMVAILLGGILALCIPMKAFAKEQTTVLYCPDEYIEICDAMEEKYNVSSCLLIAIIQTESGCNPKVISTEGCVGLCQIHPCNNPDNKNLYDPYTNIEIGTQVLLSFAEQSEGDLYLTLMRYHGESNAYTKWENNKYSSYSKKIIELAKAIENERYTIRYISPKHADYDKELCQIM